MSRSRHSLSPRQSLAPLIIRGLILIFFTGVIAGFLYLPRVYELFFDDDDVLVLHTTRETISEEALEEFERKTGIRVRITYFDTNEEMFAKFKISRGVGYDVVIPSDYMVELMVREGLFQPLSHEKISNFSEIDPRLLNKFFDRGNKYTFPIAWIPYGIAFNRDYFNLDNNVSWDIMFEPEVLKKFGNYKIAMLSDAREAIFLAAIYLYGNVKNFTEKKLLKIKDVLIKQKKIY